MRAAALAVLMLAACASAPAPRRCPTAHAPEPAIAATSEVAPPDLRAEWERLNEIVAELDHLYQSALERPREPERLAALDHAARMAMAGALPLLDALGCGDCAGDNVGVAPDLYNPGSSAADVLDRLSGALETLGSQHPDPSFACAAERAWAGTALGRFAASAGEARERRALVREHLEELANGTDDRAARRRIAELHAITESLLTAGERSRFDALRRATNARAARAEAAALVRWLDGGGLAMPQALGRAADIANEWPAEAARILEELEHLDVPVDHESRADYEDALTRVAIAVRACSID